VKKSLLLLVGAALLVPGVAQSNEQSPAGGSDGANGQSRPNIIFLLTDDQRDNIFAAMGHPFVKTPNVDRLLRQSVRFGNAYIAEPTCSPSRTALLTGMHERVNGVGFTSSYQLTPAQWRRTYPALLRKAGYYTGFVGKFGVEYYTFKGRANGEFDFWRGHDGWTRFFPKDSNAPSCTPYHEAKEDVITPIMGECMAEFLDSVPENRPFCLSVSFNVPHGSQTTSMYPDYPDWRRMSRPANENPKLKGSPFYDTLYRDLDIPIPEETATDPYRFIPEFIMDQDQGRRTQTYPYDYTRPTCREHHIRYYQTITGLDHVIGGLLADLDRRDLMKKTVIIFASDHGLLMGEYAMGGKALLYDLASKIPCFVYDPHLPADRRGRRRDELVSSLDLTKTILDYAGVEALDFMAGASLRPLVEGKDVPWREELFLENLYTGRDTPFQEGIRAGKWKYIRMYDGKTGYDESDVDFTDRKPDFEMLFDLETDPGEMNNLVESQAESDILVTLRGKCAAHSRALNQERRKFKDTVEVRER
jgi:arylsulfatase A-like enzyme